MCAAPKAGVQQTGSPVAALLGEGIKVVVPVLTAHTEIWCGAVATCRHAPGEALCGTHQTIRITRHILIGTGTGSVLEAHSIQADDVAAPYALAGVDHQHFVVGAKL